MQDVWKDENYQSQIKKIFIIGVSKDHKIKRQFENEFVNQLTIKGIEAIQSYKVLSSDKMLDRDTVVSKIKDMNIDGVIITKLIKKTKSPAGPPSFQSKTDSSKGSFAERSKSAFIQSTTYHSSYVRSHNSAFRSMGSGSFSSADIVILQIDLYDAKSEALVWSGFSKTLNQRTASNAIKPVIEVMIENLLKDNMI
jgi:hypothetical protein